MACPTKASANGLQISYVEEVDCGVTPTTPELQIIGATGESLKQTVTPINSTEIYRDRNSRGTEVIASGIAGSIPIEWRIKALAPLVIAGLQDDGSNAVAIASDMTIDATVPASVDLTAITASSFADLETGYFILLGGFADPLNNTVVRITEKVSDVLLTISAVDSTLSSETGASNTAYMYRAKNGTTRKSYTIEKIFTDMSTPAYFRYKGVEVGGFQFTFGTKALLTGGFDFIGLNEEESTVPVAGATYLNPSTDPILNTVSSIGDLWVDGSPYSYDVTALGVDLNNNSRGLEAVSKDGFVGIAHGESSTSGTVSVYFEDLAQYTRFKSQAKYDLDIPLTDSDGNMLIISMQSIKDLQMDVNATAINTDIVATGSYKAHIGDNVETISFTWFSDPTA